MASTQAKKAAPDGDRAAQFKRMFESEFGYVWGSLARLGVHPSNVEDLTHDVFLQVYSKLDAYDVARPIRPWLFGFAFRTASEYRRQARHRREVMGGDHDAAHAGPSPEAAVATAQEGQLVMKALALVPMERRAVLVAYELDAMPMKEIAASLDIPLHTAYSRLRVAREEFAAAATSLEKPSSRPEEQRPHE